METFSKPGPSRSRRHPLPPSLFQRRQNSPPTYAASNSSHVNATSNATASNSTRIVLGRGFSNGQLTYTLPITLAGQQLNFQLDTGSADIWAASFSCGTDPCKGKDATVIKLDDKRDAVIDQETPFSINYLLGSASGEIMTASMLFGDPNTSRLVINSQAFGSANSVQNENLDTGNFSGIVGFGLPAGSVIQAALNETSNTAATNNDVRPSNTGAVLTGLLTGLKPGKRFIGIGLQRLEEDGGHGDSVVTVGTHDPVYAGSSPSNITSVAVIPDADGVARHWRVYLTEMSVSLHGNLTESIPLATSSVIPGALPIALIDTGSSINFGPPSILNALYGAYGFGPAPDGGYYVPCNLEMNITISLAGVSVPIHPLDASLIMNQDAGYSTSGTNCIGSFQALRSLSSNANSNTNASNVAADFVLSSAFLRNAYSVLSCDAPNTTTGSSTTPIPCQPHVGFRPLVNKTLASEQFKKVRILKQPLGQSGLNHPWTTSPPSKGLSGGIKIMIGCLAAFVGIAGIFGVALWRLRKKRARVAQQRATMLAASAGEKLSTKRSRGASIGPTAGIDAVHVPMDVLTKFDDDSASQVGLSPAQRAKARQLNQIHGVFDDELVADDQDAPGAGPAPKWADDVGNPGARNPHLALEIVSWDVSSSGYADARRVKNEYLSKLTEEERQLFLEKQRDGEPSPTMQHGHDSRPTTAHTSDPCSEIGQHSEHSNSPLRSGSPAPLLD